MVPDMRTNRKRIHLTLKENSVSIDLEIAKGVLPKAYIVCVRPSVG